MLKSEVIKKLKQNNVSKNAEKTIERLKSIWKPLATPERDEILSLTGLVKSAIERAYKTGNASAKIIAAVSQVVEVDPLYLAGISDEQRPYNDDLVVSFLTELGYDIGKRDIVKRGKSTPVSAPVSPPKDTATPKAKVTTAKSDAKADEVPSPSSFNTLSDLPSISASLAKLLNGDIQGKLSELTEENIILMLKSLTVQSEFSADKKNRLELIKCLLLI